MQEIITAIQEHASPRIYDWLVLVVAGVAIIVSGFAAYYAYRLNKKQSEILEQQNKIALFDKRYEILRSLEQLEINISMVLSTSFDDATKNLHIEEMRHLFLGSVFYKVLSFPSTMQSTEITPVLLRKKYDIIERYIIKIEKAKFIFNLNDDERTKYQNTLGTLLTMTHHLTSGSPLETEEGAKIIYQISQNDLAPLKELKYFVTIFNNQLYLNVSKDRLSPSGNTSPN